MRTWITRAVLAAAGIAGLYYLIQLKPLPDVPSGTAALTVATSSARHVFTPGPLRWPGKKLGQVTVEGILSGTNTERKKVARPQLVLSSQLSAAAESKARDILAKQYFEHISPEGFGPDHLAAVAGYKYVSVGENLALGAYTTSADVVQSWMNSPGHRENMLSEEFEEIGVAAVSGEYEGRRVWVAVQEFGRPRSSCPAVDDQLRVDAMQETEALAQLQPQLEALKAELATDNSGDLSEHQKRVAHYNKLAKDYNEKVRVVQDKTNTYNAQVAAFNSCVGK